MRRLFLALALIPAAAFAQSAPPELTNYPVAPRAVPFSATVFGTHIDDPYRWMESDAAKPERDAWLSAASAHTVAELHALPGYAGLLADITAANRATDLSFDVQVAGQSTFYQTLSTDRDRPMLMVREGGHDRILIDPMHVADHPMAIGAVTPSPSGRYVYVQLSAGGGEVGTGRIYDVATGVPLPDVLQPTWGEDNIAWLDDRTVAYVRLRGTEGVDTSQDITDYVHRIGTPSAQDVPVLGALVTASVVANTRDESPYIETAPTSRWAMGVITTARADQRIALSSIASLAAGHPQWREVAGYSDQVQGAVLHGDTLYYLTTARLPDGEIRSLDAATGRLSTSRLVLGGSGLVLQHFVAGRDGLYVTAVRPDGGSSLLFVAYGSTRAVPVALPYAGAIIELTASADGSSAVASERGWLHNSGYFRLQGGHAAPFGIDNATDPDLTRAARVIEETAVSADGTHVPLTILAPAPGTFQGPRPTILEAYSSYGTVAAPFYGQVTLTWVRRGGIYASCHARGGGEQGRAWHEAGREANKPNGQADVIACAERLIQLHLATPATLGAWGTSAGGTIVPPAALRRPDLFRAVTASVSMLNPTRLAGSENGPMQFAEFGDPRTPAGFRALMAQDSTLLLQQARGGPDFLFTVGLNDHRVPPWETAKLLAAMHARWGNSHLALVRTDSDAGHGIGSGRDQTLALRADMFAFFLNRFGQSGFVPPAAQH